MKRFLTFITALVLCLALVLPVFAKDPLIVDEAGLLTSQEIASLTSKAESIRNDYDFEAVIVTVQTLGGSTVEAFADDYYDFNGYGCGPDHDGVLLLLAMDEREYHITTTGFGIKAFTDYGMDQMADRFVSYLSNGNYSGGFSTFLDLVRQYLEVAKNGRPIDVNYSYEDYQFDRMDASAKALYYLKICLRHLLPFLLIGFVVSLIFVSSQKSKLKSIHMQSAANQYRDEQGLKLQVCDNLFLYSTTTRTRIQTESSSRGSGHSGGGSSTHTSSSGTSHGGHSGRF
jgi:uncharacterized protein